MQEINYDQLCVLNSVDDAKYYLSSEEFSNRCLLCSTHASVNDFLNTKGIDCIQLSMFLEDDFCINKYKEADIMINEMLHFIDKAVAGEISNILGIVYIDYFHVLYRYFLKVDYVGYFNFKQALKNISARYSINKILFIGSPDFLILPGLNELVEGDQDIDGINIRFIVNEQSKRHAIEKNCNILKYLMFRMPIKKVFGLTPKLLFRAINKIFPSKISQNKKTIILFKNLYDLDFLTKELGLKKLYNVVEWPLKKTPKLLDNSTDPDDDKIAAIKSLIDKVDLQAFVSRLPDDIIIIAGHVLEKFKMEVNSNLYPLIHIDMFFQRFGTDLCIWGTPPVHSSQSLVCEYFLKRGVPVIGAQHGGVYGVQHSLPHFDTDFFRCSHYLSYGFDANDMLSAYPDRTLNCEVIPVGSYKESDFIRLQKNSLKRKTVVDILFPITNCVSIFLGTRMNDSRLAMYQTRIIDLLEELSGLRIVVKPLPQYSAGSSAVYERLKHCKNVEINTLPLRDFLRGHAPKMVVMEYPSTPLFEVLGLDADVFLLSDPIKPFTQQAMELLKKRAYVFDNIDDLTEAILKYTKGQMPKLRNNEFYNKYIYRENTEKIIIETIHSLTGTY